MDVTAAAAGPPMPEPPVRLSAPVASASFSPIQAPPQDTIATLLQTLSTPQIHDLLHGIEAHRLSPDPAALDSLLQTAGAAAAHHDVPRALAALTEYMNRNPEHAGILPSSPSLAPIQGEVKELLRRVTDDARIGAERLVATAGLAVYTAGSKHREGLDTASVLAVAGRFMESGQLVNYIRAAELGEAVIAFYGGSAPELVIGAARRGLLSQKAVPRPLWELAGTELAGTWWRRVPLLLLLLGWLAVGVACGAVMLLARLAGFELLSHTVGEDCVEVWGVGFLVLVVVQCWIRVRSFR